nr:hypothetical protein [Tanacetum cinerariifolium]
MQVPQAYAEADYSNSRLQNQNEPPKHNPFTFRECIGPNPQPQALETTFEARVRTTWQETPKEWREKEKDVVNNGAIIESIVEPSKPEEEEPPKKASVTNEVEKRVDDEPTKSVRENVTKNEEKEAAGASRVRIGKIKGKTYNLSPRGPVYEAILKKKITKNEDIGENFEIPCNIRGLKLINTLVDQGSNVNVMPFFTYSRLTNERPSKTDIRISLAKHSYIYPLGIAEDILVDVVGYVYPMDFMILNIKEDEKRPFILGTPFLTTAKAVIKFDKDTITLRSGKSKISFYRIPESLCKVEKGINKDIETISLTMTVNRLVLEWKEKKKLHVTPSNGAWTETRVRGSDAIIYIAQD